MSSGAQFVTLSSLPPCSLCAIHAAYYQKLMGFCYYLKGSKLTTHKRKILEDLEKLALHFVLDEDVKSQNLLFENRCCYLKSSPLRTRKNSARILRTTSTTSFSLPPFLTSFPSSRFKAQGSQSSLRRRPRKPTSRSVRRAYALTKK